MPRPNVPDKFRAGYIEDLDRRTRVGAAMQARWNELTDDLGGVHTLSYAQRSLAERALWLEYWLMHQEAALGEGRFNDFEPGQWVQAANSLQGIYTRLGMRRRSETRDITDLMEQRKTGAIGEGKGG
jgi:hypothetical protein